MTRDRQINAAGGFLRALQQPRGPGAQAVGGPPLPAKELLLLLIDNGTMSGDEIALRLDTSVETAGKATSSLYSLGLVDVDASGLVALTQNGKSLAAEQRAN